MEKKVKSISKKIGWSSRCMRVAVANISFSREDCKFTFTQYNIKFPEYWQKINEVVLCFKSSMTYKAFSESDTFNYLELTLNDRRPRTPVLNCQLGYCLSPLPKDVRDQEYFLKKYRRSIINWVSLDYEISTALFLRIRPFSFEINRSYNFWSNKGSLLQRLSRKHFLEIFTPYSSEILKFRKFLHTILHFANGFVVLKKFQKVWDKSCRIAFKRINLGWSSCVNVRFISRL